MRKLFQVILAVAMVVSYLPLAEAGDSATLGVTVNFAQPISIWSDLEEPPEVKETQLLEFSVSAHDRDTIMVDLYPVILPEGAEFVPVLDDPSLSDNTLTGKFTWIPDVGQANEIPYAAVFEATNDDGDIAKLEVSITVVEAVISIELVDQYGQPISTWSLEGIMLGEKRDNQTAYGTGVPIHHVRNAGDVEVMVDIGYETDSDGDGFSDRVEIDAGTDPYDPYSKPDGIVPGTTQGLDTFITGLGRVTNHVVLPRNQRLEAGWVGPGTDMPLWLTYGAPTELSKPTLSHEVIYELRAYGIKGTL